MVGFDGGVTLGEALGRAAEDIRDLALEDHAAVAVGRVLEHLDQSFEGIEMALPSFAQAAADTDPESDGAVDRGALGGGAVHAVLGDIGAAAHSNDHSAPEPLHPLVV